MEEDPPTLFIENVVFLHGNYIVYPGFNVTATKILNELFECIFLVENKLDEKFKTLIKDAAGFLLLLSNSMGTFLGHGRFLYDPSDGKELQLPDYDNVFKFLDAISFSKEFLQKNSEFYMFDRSILKEFIISLDNKGLDNDDPDENTATLFPVIEIEGETILYLPSGILPALTNFIYAKAEEFVCQDEINRILTERQFEKTILTLKHIGWKKLNFELPVVK